MKTTKRFVALLMAVVMTFALGAVALADTGREGVNYPGEGNPFEGFSVEKTIYLKNNTAGTYSVPKVTFDYEIRPAKDAELTYDPHAGGLTVFSGEPFGLLSVELTGDADAVIEETKSRNASDAADETKSLFSVTFKAAEKDFNPEKGGEWTGNIRFNFADVYTGHVTRPGVYRYKVTDVTNEEYLKSVGIIRPAGFNGSEDASFYVDLYILVDSTGKCSVGAAVTSEYKENVPDRDNNSGRILVDGDPTTTYDPKDVYVDDNGKIYTVRDGAGDNPAYPADYTVDTGKVAKMVPGLEKTDDPYGEDPVSKFTDTNGDGVPDVDEHGVPTDKTNTEVAHDDEGNIIGQDGKSYPVNEYDIKDDGQIMKKDGTPATDDNGDPVYAKYYGKYDYKTDAYTSFNVVLKKSITGDLADPEHQFPFVITVNNQTAETTPQTLLKYYYKDKDAGIVGTESTVTTQSANLADQDAFIVRGLNPHATVNYQETNNTTFDFKVERMNSKDAKETIDDNLTSNKSVSAYATAQTVAPYNDTNRAFQDEGMAITTIINNQKLVSPTGVVLRFAPYILMLGAAFFFVALSRRRREQENA